MKIIKLTALLVVIFQSSFIMAREENISYQNHLHFGALQLMFNEFFVSYERMYDNFGTQVSAKFVYKDAEGDYKEGIQFQIDQKIYLKDVICSDSRFYIAPGIKYRYVQLGEGASADEIYTYGVQFVAGSVIPICSRLTADIYLGGTILKSSDNNHNDNYLRPGYSGIASVFNCTFGFLF
jgi:hypothetical protein